MNVLFVNYHDFSSNSAIHIFHFANQLIEIGVDCGVCVPNNKQTVHLIGEAKFKVYNYKDFNNKKAQFQDGRGPDIIHAWTPREVVREFTLKLKDYYDCKIIVHLEDNEEAIIKATYNIDSALIKTLPEKVLSRILDKQYSHPIKYKQFLEQADGITAIIDRLLEFKPQHKQAEVIWPGYEETLFMPQPADIRLKNKLGISHDDFVVVYSGNVHHSNRTEVYNLYLAIAALNRIGLKIKLVRTGRDFVDLYDDVLNEWKDCFINLGFVDRTTLPKIMALSDVFVQPGKADEFNEFRFPSKIPEFFAMGKTVILPRSNIGKYLSDEYNCFLLYKGDALEISGKIEFVYKNKDECELIGKRGREFAVNNFKWSINSKKLFEFYLNILNNAENARRK